MDNIKVKLEKDDTLTIRISHQAKEVIRQRAATEGKTLTDYITTLALENAGTDEGDLLTLALGQSEKA